MIVFRMRVVGILFLLVLLSVCVPPVRGEEDNHDGHDHDHDHDESVASVTQVTYSSPTDGTNFVGYYSIPEGASSASPVPAVIIIHDANGIDKYEKKRLVMLAQDFGYAGFAADVFGADLINGTREEKRALAGQLRSTELRTYLQRMKLAVDQVKRLPFVDAENVGMMGYCFGGTGVLAYALAGFDGLQAVVSFHGGLTTIVGPANSEDNELSTVTPPKILTKVMVQSGGDDDTSSNITTLETKLDEGNATWEMTRYANVQHSFTNFYDEKGRYHERADTNSWAATGQFLREAFGQEEFTSTIAPSMEGLTNVTYMDGDVELVGHVSIPQGASNVNQVPAIIILPDWDMVTDYEKLRLRSLADDLGYVGFAADIYGANFTNFTRDGQIEQVMFYMSNPDVYVGRIQAAIDQTKALDFVDPDNVAMIGYCFGGTGVLAYALSGLHGVKGVVSFHGSLARVPPSSVAAGMAITTEVLIHSGGDDDSAATIAEIEEKFNAVNATWELTRYSKVLHGFTNFLSQSGAYNVRADARSWTSMVSFLDHLFKDEEEQGDEVLATQRANTDSAARGTSDVQVAVCGFVTLAAVVLAML